MTTILQIDTPGRAAVDVTAKIADVAAASNAPGGLAHLFIQHTSASLTVQENADPDVMADLLDWLDRTAPENGPYRHRAEGPDDMPAHLKSAMTATSLFVPFENGRLLLGTWQGIYLLEHRRAPHRRRIAVTLAPEL
ncbi:secondary thiamine-phosphate synthase enzyme YjbQ [Hyphococcus luteus]|uniref:Secondary thiamine-phosphate synthase enzyme n=1 Tax=Hyphococcus luteus TaxID=2058213 RepID=A0A2S7K5N1_9PROT|nr:secondary thiamine-phosphate synthase enzyme YjbQ [Marinicaulis flavus]PQA87813.1 secondary thiamine-phosphate synthase enzyme [Marinicaulis flavus]